MKQYNGLLSAVAEQYSICKGARETEQEWKARLVYTICGMMAYASLWDEPDEKTVSIVHLKRRIRRTLTSYRMLYPEISDSLSCNSEEIEDEIVNQFLSTGVVYHRPDRVAPGMKREEASQKILFQRGIALDSISCVSGIGFYAKPTVPVEKNGVQEMFGLGQQSLQELWSATLSTASWRRTQMMGQAKEYLRTNPPFQQGYWMNKPNRDGKISILRTGMKGSYLYYLYRYVGGTDAMEVSQLPAWRVEEGNYRALACACLFNRSTLPPVTYVEDGELVHLQMGYLLPPTELAFLKLYSWPERCTTLPCDFQRKLSKKVFDAIRDIFIAEGYSFKRRTC